MAWASLGRHSVGDLANRFVAVCEVVLRNRGACGDGDTDDRAVDRRTLAVGILVRQRQTGAIAGRVSVFAYLALSDAGMAVTLLTRLWVVSAFCNGDC